MGLMRPQRRGRLLLSNIKITWVKSCIGYPKDQAGTLNALGLRRRGQVVELPDSLVVKGMINKVRHLVKVEVVA